MDNSSKLKLEKQNYAYDLKRSSLTNHLKTTRGQSSVCNFNPSKFDQTSNYSKSQQSVVNVSRSMVNGLKSTVNTSLYYELVFGRVKSIK